jgi:hypothetical protein
VDHPILTFSPLYEDIRDHLREEDKYKQTKLWTTETYFLVQNHPIPNVFPITKTFGTTDKGKTRQPCKTTTGKKNQKKQQKS